MALYELMPETCVAFEWWTFGKPTDLRLQQHFRSPLRTPHQLQISSPVSRSGGITLRDIISQICAMNVSPGGLGLAGLWSAVWIREERLPIKVN
jgi:hypothetical protein